MFEDGVSVLGPLKESVSGPGPSALESGGVCGVLPVFVLEDLLLHEIIKVLVCIVALSVVYKVIECWVELSLIGNVHLVEFLINPVVFWVVLKLGLEVVTILLLFLSQIAKEESVVSDPSVTLSVEHSSLSTLVIDWISHGPCVKLLDLVEDAIKLHDRLLDLVPGLVHIAAKWYLLLEGKVLHLFIHNRISCLEGVDLLMCLLLPLHLVRRIDEDTIGLVVVHVDVYIGTR